MLPCSLASALRSSARFSFFLQQNLHRNAADVLAALCGVDSESRKGDAWRTVVVQESTTLFNLHRIIQIAFCKSKLPSDSVVEKQVFSFYLRSDKLKAPKSNELASTAGTSFMKGQAHLKYEAGGQTYTVRAGKRAIAETQFEVPRCIKGSGEAELDRANIKFLQTRFSKVTARNRNKKPPMQVICIIDTPQEELQAGQLASMRRSVTADSETYKAVLKYEANEAKRKAERAAAAAAKKAKITNK